MSLRIRRGGGGAPGPPSPPATFGPTDGAAAVRLGAGARTVTDPGGGISFNSSGSLQSAINANPTNSVFVCSVNTPVWNSTVNTGTKRPTIIFPGPVGQKIIDGAGANINAVSAGDGTVVRGGTWRNFGSVATTQNGFITQNDCTIEDAVVHNCAKHGISVQGLNNVISHCTLHTNGIQGMQTGNTGLFQTDNLEIAYCEMYGNNTSQQNPGIEGGAHKYLFSGNGHHHHNWIHDNIGFGAWWDTENYRWLIEENVLEDNSFAGLMLEANYGMTVRRNYIANNGRNVTIGGAPATFLNVSNIRMTDNAAARTDPSGAVTPIDFHLNLIDHNLAASGQTGGLIALRDHTDISTRHVSNHDIHNNQWWIRFTQTLGGRVSRIRPEDQDTVGLISQNYQLWDLDNNFFSNDYRVVNTTSNFWAWGSGVDFGTDEPFSTWSARWSGETRSLI